MENTEITFIGGGNMAEALIRGLLAGGHPAGDIRVCDPVDERRTLLAGLGVQTSATGQVAASRVVVLAVKPQVLSSVVSGLALTGSELVISIAAGVPLSSLTAWCPAGQPLVRCMPNTPALIQSGMTALFANPAVSAADRQLAESVLAAAGATLWVNSEAELDAVTAVSGSGPAYFLYLMESMMRAGQRLGLDAQTARTLTLQTAVGAALLARDSDVDPATLRARVTSPGGTTERAISILERHQVAAAIEEAVHQAAIRSEELAKEFGSA